MGQAANNGPFAPTGFASRILAMLLPVALLIGAGAFFICQIERKNVHEARANVEELGLNVGSAALGRNLKIADDDLLYLASRDINREVLDNPTERNLSRLAKAWAEFSNAKKHYDQIRWIDETGMERVRVNYEGGKAVIVPSSELQDKRNRYFFSEAISLNAGEVYVSPLDLNFENDQVEVPYKPTVRFGVPVFDSNGNRRGIFLINYLAQRMLDRFASDSMANGSPAWLVNEDGYWLRGPSPSDEFGFVLGFDDLTMTHRYPRAWNKILSGESGQFESEEGLWTFATVYPLKKGDAYPLQRGEDKLGRGRSEPITPNMMQPEGRGYAWKAVSFLPIEQYDAGLAAFTLRIGTASLVLLALFFVCIWWLARYQMQEKYARLILEQTVKERTQTLFETNERLSVEQLRLRSLLQTLPDLVWLKDTEGVYLLCNRNFERFFGAREQDIVDKTDYDFLSKELADFFRENDQAAIDAGGPRVNEEWVTFAADGQRALLETTKVPVRTAGGNLIGVLGIGRDITKHREAQKRERQLKNIYRALSATNEAIIHQVDEAALFALVCQIAVDYGEMALAWIGIADQSRQRIIVAANYGPAAAYAEEILVTTTPDRPEGRGVIGVAYREGQPGVINDIETDESFAPWREKIRHYGIKSTASFPIMRAGKPYAVFSIYSSLLNDFEKKIISLLEGMARNIGFALDNFDRERFRHQAEEALQASEKRLKQFYDARLIGVIYWNLDGRITDANDKFLDMVGHSRQELEDGRLRWKDMLAPESGQISEAALAELKRTAIQRQPYEKIYRRKDGSPISIEIAAAMLDRENGVAFVLDITERKKARQELQEKEQLLSLFVENAPAAIAMFDRDMRYLAVSKRLLDDFNQTKEDLIGKSFYESLPGTLSHWKEIDRRVLAGETIRCNEERYVQPNGKVDWLQWEKRPWFAHGEVGGMLLFVECITERKETEERMRLAAMVYQDSSEGMLVTDAQNTIIAVNPAFEHITGYKEKEVIGKAPSFLKSGRHGPEFYQAMWKSINETGRWHGEIWNRDKNGRDFAELITINTSYNPDGSIFRRAALFSDITKKKESDDLIWQQANFDALTGLPNRRLFRDHLDHEIRKARRTGLPMALMLIDLDGFKDVNDTLGHDMGDLLLKEAARRLQGCVREMDTVARLGGDEFTVILSELNDPRSVDRIARHILQQLALPILLGEESAHVSASIGITLFPQDTSVLEDLLKNADQAMYSAKHEGKNRYHFFTQAMQEVAMDRMRLINDLRSALDQGQIDIVYQPIIELKTGCISKAEALIRWQHPAKGMVNPEDFVSAAEETGLITSLGNWMVHEAVNQASMWRTKYHPQFQISVNVSPVQFRNGDIDFMSWMEQLKTMGMPGDAIVIEITEGLLLEASEKVKKRLLDFRDAGIEVSLDDFGTGYSSLSYLQKFDIDYLKIDQSFIHNLAPDSTNLALCRAIIEMAHSLNIKVIAEGVETDEQRDLLTAAGCDYVQGYLFSKPLPAGMLDDFLQRGTWLCGRTIQIQ